LRNYRVSATFYVSPDTREIPQRKRLSIPELNDIANEFEVGAHTLTHPRLPELSDAEAQREIGESKEVLECHLGRSVTSFCYPGGAYNERHIRMVETAGFRLARTVRQFVTEPDIPLELGTTIHAFSHPSAALRIAKLASYNPPRALRYARWDGLAVALFDRVKERGGVFHLWGHSWEIDQRGEWERLKHVLDYVGGRSDVEYATNAQLVT